MIRYKQDMFNGNSLSTAMTWGDPFAFKNSTDSEMRVKNRDDRDSDQGPAPEPGDSYIILAAIAGFIIGGALGVLIAVNTAGSSGIFIGLVAGCIAGGFIGTYIGSFLKKRKTRDESGLTINEDKGPFSG